MFTGILSGLAVATLLPRSFLGTNPSNSGLGFGEWWHVGDAKPWHPEADRYLGSAAFGRGALWDNSVTICVV